MIKNLKVLLTRCYKKYYKGNQRYFENKFQLAYFYWHWRCWDVSTCETCFNLRHVVYGYDRYPSDITKALVAEGIKVIHDIVLWMLYQTFYVKNKWR